MALQKPKHCIYKSTWDGPELNWRPSIFMPRWASRITLRITDVRVERLKDISEADAQAEGVEQLPVPAGFPQSGKEMWKGYQNKGRAYRDTAIDSFMSLWQSINGPDSWSQNPYVWVIEFEPVFQNVDPVLDAPHHTTTGDQ